MRRTRDRTAVIALAATAWGLDGLLREPLATTLHPATLVLWEHLVVMALLVPMVPRASRAFRSAPARDRWAVAVIGVGASAVATTLFSQAFALAAAGGDFITPLVLQKLQPVVAVGLAVVVLGERLRVSFAYYCVPALIGAWMLTFPHPLDVSMPTATVALLALGAATLWASGTVLGRLVSTSYRPVELTTLRYAFGLPAAFTLVLLLNAPLGIPAADIGPIALLALIPGLGGLCLYYYGLRATAASRATFAELAFPATAALIGVLFLNSTLTTSQWTGFAILAIAVTALGWHEQSRQPAVRDPRTDIPLSQAR